MAVENRYVNADTIADKLANPVFVNGAETVTVIGIVPIIAADDDGSVFRLCNVNAKMIPVSITVTNTAITGGTDYDIGIYDTLEGPNGGGVKDADALADGLSVASARAEGSGVSGLSAVPVANAGQALYELAGDTASDHPSAYDIAITANTVGTADGTVVVKIELAQS